MDGSVDRPGFIGREEKEEKDSSRSSRCEDDSKVIIPVVWRGRHDKLDVLKAGALSLRCSITRAFLEVGLWDRSKAKRGSGVTHVRAIFGHLTLPDFKAAEDIKACLSQQGLDVWLDSRRETCGLGCVLKSCDQRLAPKLTSSFIIFIMWVLRRWFWGKSYNYNRYSIRPIRPHETSLKWKTSGDLGNPKALSVQLLRRLLVAHLVTLVRRHLTPGQKWLGGNPDGERFKGPRERCERTSEPGSRPRVVFEVRTHLQTHPKRRYLDLNWAGTIKYTWFGETAIPCYILNFDHVIPSSHRLTTF